MNKYIFKCIENCPEKKCNGFLFNNTEIKYGDKVLEFLNLNKKDRANLQLNDRCKGYVFKVKTKK